MKTRLCLVSLAACMGVCVGTSPSSFGAEATAPVQVQLRQRIIRAPEEEVMKALADKPNDELLAKQILQWVESGRAKVVSDLTVPANPKVRFEAKDGKVYKWVTENRLHYRIPMLTPHSWQDVFLGIRVQGENRTEPWPENPPAYVPGDPFSGPPVKPEEIPGGKHALWFSFATETRALMDSKVKWPLVWPESEKPAVGTYEQDDFLVQNVSTNARLQPGRENVVAFLPPATDLETEPETRKLDVVLMHAGSAKAATLPDNTNFPVAPRIHLAGFGLSDQDALELLSTRLPDNDAALMTKVQSMMRDGKAIRRVALGLQTASGGRSTIASVREHSFPTEMPTIPSAWDTRPVGTRVELDPIDRCLVLSFEHHPARFRWAEWACALDAPELIMRQPQFFVQHVDTGCHFPPDNVVLLAAMRTPECLKGSDKGPVIGETLLLFAELNQPAGTPPLPSLPLNKLPQQADLEAMIFELPAADPGEWNGTDTSEPVDDELRFRNALKKVKEGAAKVICHLSMAAESGRRAEVKTAEEVLFVTEYNPVAHNPTGRYRPTALERRLVGSIWKVDTQISNAEGFGGTVPVIHLNSSLLHDVLPAVQPDLKASLKHAQENDYQLLEPTFTTDEWKGSLNLLSGKARCLGPVRPKAAPFQNRIHVAFVRAVVRK